MTFPIPDFPRIPHRVLQLQAMLPELPNQGSHILRNLLESRPGATSRGSLMCQHHCGTGQMASTPPPGSSSRSYTARTQAITRPRSRTSHPPTPLRERSCDRIRSPGEERSPTCRSPRARYAFAWLLLRSPLSSDRTTRGRTARRNLPRRTTRAVVSRTPPLQVGGFTTSARRAWISRSRWLTPSPLGFLRKGRRSRTIGMRSFSSTQPR